MRYSVLLVAIIFSHHLFGQDYYSTNSKSFFEKGYVNDTAKLESLNVSLLQAAIFHATNLERSKKRQFKYDKNLEKGAVFHSLEMLTNNFFSHTNRKNKKYKTPALRAKKHKAKFAVVGENILDEIALNYTDNSLYDAKLTNSKYVYYDDKTGHKILELTYKNLAEKIVKSWMHSPGHKANILDKEYSHLGIGVAIVVDPYAKDDLPSVIVTQLFGGN